MMVLPIAILISVAATCSLVCVGAVSCTTSDDTDGKEHRRVYTIATGIAFSKSTYLSDDGYHEGFFKDITSAVCAEAGMDCRFITVPWTWCWQSQAGQHQRGGEGLLDNWFDACVGYFQTTARVQVFRFSQPFLKTPVGAYFYAKIHSNYTLDDLFDNKKIGFVNGWATDEQCVARVLGNAIAVKNVVHFLTDDTLAEALIVHEVDAIFIGESSFKDHFDPKTMKKIGTIVDCILGNSGIMSQIDNDIVAKWNEGFYKLLSSGRYKRLCDEANKRHSRFDEDLACI